MTFRSVLLLMAFALAIVGCQRAVQLRSATLRGASPAGLQFDAVLSIENPNVFDVQVRAVRANARMGKVGGYIPVNATPNTWIPAGKKMLVPVPIVVPWSMLPSIVAAHRHTAEGRVHRLGYADITATRCVRDRPRHVQVRRDRRDPAAASS